MSYPDGNRFAVSTADNQQAWLWIASLLSLMYSLVVLVARVIVKWGLFALNDVVLSIAYILAMAHWIATYAAISDGLGKSASLLNSQSISTISKLVFTSRILLLTSIALTKCTVILFLQQMFTRSNARAWKMCNTTAIIMAAWAAAAPLIVSVGCRPERTIESGANVYCSGDISRWRVIAAIEVILEVILVALPAYLISSLQMNIKKKLTVMVAFSFRIGTALLAIACVVSYAAYLTHGRTSIGMVETLVWQEAWLAYALLSATVPVLKGFIGRFTTADLVRLDPGSSGVRTGPYSSKQWRSAGSGMRSGHREEGGKDTDAVELRPMETRMRTDVWHDDQRREAESIGSNGSEQMIIHRRVELEVREQSFN